MAHTLLGETFRKYSIYLSESPFLQWFCRLDQGSEIRVPGKSTLQRYSNWLPEEQMREVINELLGAVSMPPEGGMQMLNLAAPLDLASYFLDTTCVKLNIHFPVDWVLLRDAARTLMKATTLIRNECAFKVLRQGFESADGGAGRIPQENEPVVHQDDARAAQEGCQADS